jgi:hypothetical protein
MPTRKRRILKPESRRLVIRADLLAAKPPIWRRLELSPGLTLAQVHWALQTAFEWDDSHLHEFVASDEGARGSRISYSPPEFELGELGIGSNDDTNVVFLGDVLRVPGNNLTYIYDFGDSWRHGLVLERWSNANRTLRPPAALPGAGHHLPKIAAASGSTST